MNYKRFFRSRTDRKIAGVCGGIAEYFNIDSTIVRLVFAVSIIVFGSGIGIYLITWILTPEQY